ncbi:MAG: hypothetical protein AAF694_05365 [Bacteroidota bacterium]
MRLNISHLFLTYITLWSICFSLYNYIDGDGMMDAFGINTGGASAFIMLNSAGRYIALAIALIFGIWVFRSFFSILTALLARLGMDVLDLIVGLKTEIIADFTGVIQSFLMFLLPNIISIWLLIRFKNKSTP